MECFRKIQTQGLLLLLLLHSGSSEAIWKYCRKIVSEYRGQSPAGRLLEQAATMAPAGDEALPYRFEKARKSWRPAVFEETTGVLLYVENGDVVAEVQLGSSRTLSRRFSEAGVVQSIQHLGGVDATKAHSVLSAFMDGTVFPALLRSTQKDIAATLKSAADATGNVFRSTATQHMTTWWPIDEGESTIGFHYEGLTNAGMGRLLEAARETDDLPWIISQVRLNGGRAENLVFVEVRGKTRVFHWAEPLFSCFGDSTRNAEHLVTSWSNSVGEQRMLAAELDEAQTRALDVSPIKISRAHLLGRDPRKGYKALDMLGMTVRMLGTTLNGQSALVVEQIPSGRPNRFGGGSAPFDIKVRTKTGAETIMSRTNLVPVVDYLIDLGMDPATLRPFVFSKGDRVIELRSKEAFKVLQTPPILASYAGVAGMMRVERVGDATGTSELRSVRDFFPAHYYLPLEEAKLF